MKKSESSHLQFDHRPSTFSINRSSSFQKKYPAVTESTSEGKVLEFDNFNYVIKRPDKRESTNNNYTVYEKGDRRNSVQTELKNDPLSKAIRKERFGLEISSLENILEKEITNRFLECIYFTSIYVVNNYVGRCGSKSEEPRKLFKFIDQLLPLPSKIKHHYSKKAKKVKAPDYVLNVNVIEAVDLISTDVDGLSDPFCKIWLNNQKENMQETDIKKHTLSPKWDENFSFRLKDLTNDVLHIEVWDKDPSGIASNIKQIGKVKGLRGFFLFCRECYKNICTCGSKEIDDFVGKVDVAVKEVCCEGMDDWIALKDAKDKSTEGKLHILAEFKALRPKHIFDSLKRHALLFKVCLQQSLEKNKDSHLTILRWEQLLSPAAFTLMIQHTIQSSLTLLEDALCRFVVFVHLVKNQASISYQFLYNITDEMYEGIQQSLNTDYELESSFEDLLRKAVDDVYELCKSVITALHSTDFVEDESKCTEFEFVLRCINVCHNISGRQESLWAILKSEAANWFEQMENEINNTAPEVRTDSFIKKLNFILLNYSVLDKLIRNIFPDKSYTQITYEILDTVFWESLKFHIITLGEEFLNTHGETKERKIKEALEIFVKLKELIEYIIKTADVSPIDLLLGNFREWFCYDIVVGWFSLKQKITILQIKRIISSDELENDSKECAGRLEKQSSSVVLAVNVIQKELIQLWHLVSYPKDSRYDITFLDALHSVCMNYTECLLDLICSRNILDNFQNYGRRKLCVMANNLWSLAMFVRETISVTVKSVPPDSFDTKFCLKLMCLILCTDICKEFERDIVTHIKHVVEANSRRKQARAVNAYARNIKYLFSEKIMVHMAFEVGLLFVREMWKCILKAIRFFKEAYKDADILSTFNKCKRFFVSKPCISTGLLSVLTETEKLCKLCFTDDRGKLQQFIWNDDYKTLKNELQQSVMYN